MGIELELYVLIGLLTLGASIFAVFEVETPRWRKVLKSLILVGGDGWTLLRRGALGACFPPCYGSGGISGSRHLVS